jgi:hypothetical protein
MIQSAFTAGELSPRLMSRTDLKGYKEGAQAMLNCIPVSQGPCYSRGGTYHTQRLQNRQTARLIPFPVKPDEAYMMVFYGNKILVLQESGLPASGNMLVNGRFQQLGTGWTVYTGTGGNQGTVTFAIGTCLLDATAANPAAVRQSVASVVGHQMTLAVTSFTRLNPTIRIGTSAGGSQIGTYNMGTRAVYQVSFLATAATTWIEISQDAGSPGNSIISSVGLIDDDAVVPLPASELTGPYFDNALQGIQYEIQPAGNVMYLVHPLVPPQKITYTSPGVFSIETITFTAPPTEWATDNYPGTLTFSDGRLWLAGCPDNPSKIWASKSGVYTDFTIGTAADAALAYAIAKSGTIRWIKGVKSLLIGTDNTEFVISSKDGVITPSDITIEPQSAYGSLATSPLPIGNQILYIGSDGRKLRAMGYRFEESGWVSTDMTFPSEHITKGKIYEMAWAQNPDNVIWMATLDGGMVGCTYDRPNSLIGWHRHNFTDGRLMSIAALRFIGTDFTWCAVRYVVNGINEIHICIMSTLGASTIYTDNTLRFESATATTLITGLGYLEGYTVQVVGDGSVQSDKVVTGGQITADRACKVFLVGLKMPRRLETMPVEAAAEPQASETAMKRFNKIYVRTLESLRPIINGVRPPTRHPSTPMDTPDPWTSEDIQVMNLGWNRKESLIIEEDLPIPFTIISIFGEMGVSA